MPTPSHHLNSNPGRSTDGSASAPSASRVEPTVIDLGMAAPPVAPTVIDLSMAAPPAEPTVVDLGAIDRDNTDDTIVCGSPFLAPDTSNSGETLFLSRLPLQGGAPAAATLRSPVAADTIVDSALHTTLPAMTPPASVIAPPTLVYSAPPRLVDPVAQAGFARALAIEAVPKRRAAGRVLVLFVALAAMLVVFVRGIPLVAPSAPTASASALPMVPSARLAPLPAAASESGLLVSPRPSGTVSAKPVLRVVPAVRASE